MRGRFDSVILQRSARLLLPILALVSLFFFFRGHGYPGGGFIAGLIMCAGLLIHALAFGIEEARRTARIGLPLVYGLGWCVAVAAALVPLAVGANFLASAHREFHLGWLGDWHLVGSSVFDAAVYLIVVGVVTDLVLGIASEPEKAGKRDEG